MTGKKLLFGLLIIFFVVVVILFLNFNKTTSVETGKIKVVTTLYPLYDFAKEIGQKNIDVTLLLPPGVEAHSFEPKPSDVVRINQADVFIYTGKFMEPWIENIIKGITNKNLLIVNISDDIKLIPIDPHIWLDFDNTQIMVNTITKAFIKKDPANKLFYEQNAKTYNQKLSNLDQKYRSVFSSCKTKEIIYGGHYAFGYLAKRYGLKYLAAQGVSPDSEPTANDLIALVNQIKKDSIKYVFYEELVSPKIAETLAAETQTKLLLLSAAHNVKRDNQLSFLGIMNNNLDNLKIGLECK